MNYMLNNNIQYKYFTLISMLSITMMIISMLFTYRVIQLGPFMAPGGVFIFALTYTIADIITEVYGFKMVKQVIFGTLFCIIFFNITCLFLINLPVPKNATYVDAYNFVFSHNLNLLVGFSVSFIISDLVNAYTINKWRILLKGKYFWLRSIGSSAIGETLFGIFAAALMYSNILSFLDFFKVISSTWLIKISISIIASYPATIAVELLKKLEGIEMIDSAEFKRFSF
jgi:uncharacterized integral membrane protein (TIGR00697 family)